MSAAGLAAVAVPIVFGPASANPSRAVGQAQSTVQSQNVATTAPAYAYEVISVKPCKPGTSGGFTMNTPDGYKATCALLIILIDYAYGIHYVEQLPGAPSWISSERFDVDARMDVPVAEALQKMSKDDRALAREQMLQALLADRFKLVAHRETRELSVYTLVIAKNGSKLKVVKPDDNSPDRIKDADGHAATNVVSMGASGGAMTMTGQAVSMATLARLLSVRVGRIVVDKTGLTGNFDFYMKFTAEEGGLSAASSDAPGGASSLPPSDPGAPSIFTAIQEGLGLKLEAVKAPIEVIVIDHIERPSGN
ncbi:MAG: TIGR03435 family protein [Candidatus Acidiferrales bacterium]